MKEPYITGPPGKSSRTLNSQGPPGCPVWERVFLPSSARAAGRLCEEIGFLRPVRVLLRSNSPGPGYSAGNIGALL